MNNAPCGMVFNEKNQVLLVNRRFPPYAWGPPAGFPDHGEAPQDTVEREVLEETGITCIVLAPLGDYEYEEYNARLNIYVCDYLFGKLRCSFESKDIGWFFLDELPDNLSPSREVFYKAFDLYNLSKRI